MSMHRSDKLPFHVTAIVNMSNFIVVFTRVNTFSALGQLSAVQSNVLGARAAAMLVLVTYI